MELSKIASKWRKFVNDMNERGIPVPTARDPKTKQGSVSFTMVCVSFGLMTICCLFAIALVVNKLGGFFDNDANSIAALKEAFLMAFQMAGLSAGLYWGRKFQRDEKGAVTIEGGKDNAQSEEGKVP